jgi:hypothetical protein
VTLEELEKTLPNGLHDGELVGIEVDYASRVTVLRVNVDISDTDEGNTYRAARLTFTGTEFVIIDPPATSTTRRGLSSISAGPGQPETAPAALPTVPEGSFLCWIFLSSANSFIRLAARDVTYDWVR